MLKRLRYWLVKVVKPWEWRPIGRSTRDMRGRTAPDWYWELGLAIRMGAGRTYGLGVGIQWAPGLHFDFAGLVVGTGKSGFIAGIRDGDYPK